MTSPRVYSASQQSLSKYQHEPILNMANVPASRYTQSGEVAYGGAAHVLRAVEAKDSKSSSARIDAPRKPYSSSVGRLAENKPAGVGSSGGLGRDN